MKKEIAGGPVPAYPRLAGLVHAGLRRAGDIARRWQSRRDQIRELEWLLDGEDQGLRDVGLTRDAVRAELSALRRGRP